MLDVKLYGEYITSWCPGCGNHDVLAAVKQALAICDVPPEKLLMVSGIGQAAKAPHYVHANVFNGLHGRALPAAIGAHLANPELTVIAESGDGCMYGEGGNHFLAAMRRNANITILGHNNGIYGLTKGQASPTSTSAITSKAQPYGVFSTPFNPLTTALTQGAGFVARGFSGDKEGLPLLIAEAIRYQGTSFIDIFSPCVSFNKVNTFAWYKKRCKPLPESHNPSNKAAAMALAEEWEEMLPLGVLYRREGQPTMESHFPVLAEGALARRALDVSALQAVQEKFM